MPKYKFLVISEMEKKIYSFEQIVEVQFISKGNKIPVSQTVRQPSY